MLKQYRKSIFATLGAVATWGTTACIDGISAPEWWTLFVAVLTGLGVYQVRNGDAPVVYTEEKSLEHLGE